MLDKSNGHLQLVFINMPLEMHPFARRAALAALAAEAQGKFWPMYDAIYAHQEELEKGKLTNPTNVFADDARLAHLDMPKYKAAIAAAAVANRLNQHLATAANLQVQSTPTFLLRHGTDKTVYEFVGLTGGGPNHGFETLEKNLPWRGHKLPSPT